MGGGAFAIEFVGSRGRGGKRDGAAAVSTGDGACGGGGFGGGRVAEDEEFDEAAD